MDTWSEIREFQRRHRAVCARLRRRRKQRRQRLIDAGVPFYFPPSSSPVLSSPPSTASTPVTEYRGPLQSALERRVQEQLLNPLLEFPLASKELSGKLGDEEGVVWELLLKFSAQELLELQLADIAISSINADRLSALVEGAARRKDDPIPPVSSCKTRRDNDELIEKLLTTPSVREVESRRMGTEIYELLNTKSVMEQRQLEKFQSAGGSQLQEFCSHKTRDSCRRARGTHRACGKLHFRKIIQQHTEESLGDCSFLNTCFHTDTCKFVHYEIDTQREVDTSSQRQSNKNKPTSGVVSSHKLIPAQWVNCDIRILDMNCLGKFSVIMADPPWDIHMELPYGTMGDDEMRQLNVPALQDDGYIFLWVTGRAMELARECLTLWGYERVDELIWVKTNQLQRLIRTGRTGHWLNHGKEHCLVGVKGNLPVSDKSHLQYTLVCYYSGSSYLNTGHLSIKETSFDLVLSTPSEYKDISFSFHGLSVSLIRSITNH
jgi:mRNA (2'-O-methyladenosine-N6-)-methyltransferase